jgi:hypothetical protein
MNLSRVEAEFQMGVQQTGGFYEHEGGSTSGSRSGNPVSRLFQRATSQRESPVLEDCNLTSGGRRGMTQPRIGTGSWTQKGENADDALVKLAPNFSTLQEYL